MKEIICTITGMAGAIVSTLFGGWTSGMATLVILMAVDYISGLIVAGVFKKSKKSATGALESKAGWKGLIRKIMTLVFVAVFYRLDLMLGTTYLQDAIIIGFVLNELISLVENAGLMGLPLPAVVTKAIDLLQAKADDEKE